MSYRANNAITASDLIVSGRESADKMLHYGGEIIITALRSMLADPAT